MAVTPSILVLGKEADTAEGDERDLLERLARGEAAVFDELVAAHQARLLRLARRLLGWDPQSEDVVQEVFLVALRRIGRFEGRSSLATWLAAITVRMCRRWRRRRWMWWKWLRRARSEKRPAAESSPPAERDETCQRVRRAVQELSAADREVIVLYYLEEMSAADMAQVLEISPNAVGVRLHRARERLRGKLEELLEE